MNSYFFLDKNPVVDYIGIYGMISGSKGNDKEEYVQPLGRENGPSAERLFEERRAEGSFGTGGQNYETAFSKLSRFIPVNG